MRAQSLVGVLVLGLSACTPIPAFHFAETSAVLKKKAVSITAAGGAGASYAPTTEAGQTGRIDVMGGVGGRLRVGVGRKQEIGVEGTGLFVLKRDAKTNATSYDVPWAAKLSWKGAPASWVAFMAGVGPTHYLEYGLGGDVALVISPKIPVVPLRVYTGARLGVAGPLAADAFAIGGLTVGGVVPLGLAVELPLVHIFIEGGFVGARTWVRNLDDTQVIDVVDALGGYGMAGLGLYFGGTE